MRQRSRRPLKDTEPAELLQALRVVMRGDALLSPAVTRRLVGEFVTRPPDAVAVAVAVAGMEALTTAQATRRRLDPNDRRTRPDHGRRTNSPRSATRAGPSSPPACRLVAAPPNVASYATGVEPWTADDMNQVISIEPQFISGIRLIARCA